MKKFFIMLVVLGGICGYSHATSAVSETPGCTISEMSSSQQVRAQEIKRNGNLWVKKYVDATYDSESNKLYVKGESYSVYTNDLYQNVDDARGNYRYVAGNFYFNL